MTGYSALTDQELTVLLKNGDRAAFMEIYHRYKKILYKHGYKWLQDSEEVKDVISSDDAGVLAIRIFFFGILPFSLLIAAAILLIYRKRR